MKIFIVTQVHVMYMSVPLSLRAAGILSFAIVVAASALYMPEAAPTDPYQATMRLAAGLLFASGSLSLSRSIGRTLLRGGGNGAFKALYCAGFVSAGTGICGASSAYYAMNLPLAASIAAVSFSGAGLMLLRFLKGG